MSPQAADYLNVASVVLAATTNERLFCFQSDHSD